MPDISLLPSIAAFFDVSIDELFDYNVLENERRAESICREAAGFRNSDPARAEEILRAGLAQFPANEHMLLLLLYTLLAMPKREDDSIRICNDIFAHTKNDSIRYDVVRILAETYAATGKQDMAEATLHQIPELYFSKLECMAKLLTGEQALEAAQFQMNLSAKTTVEMLLIMSEEYEKQEKTADALSCRNIASGILRVYQQENGQRYEPLGYAWSETLRQKIK